MTDTNRPPEPLELVRAFCAEWADLDLDRVMDYFTDDAVYHNIPIDPAVGREAIRAFIEGFLGQFGGIVFNVRHIVADGNVVMTERVDVFQLPNGLLELPVMGTFEVVGGKIAAWRDYFDMGQFMAALNPS